MASLPHHPPHSHPHHDSAAAAAADASPAAPGSASSTPRGGGRAVPPPQQQQQQQVRLMCSFGGRILPRPHDHQLRYVGGETRIVSVPRSASFALLLSLLSKLLPSSPSPNPKPNSPPPIVKYQLPHEDLDALISVTSDEDVDNMMDELDRLSSSSSSSSSSSRTPRLRLFLFSSSSSSSSSSPSPSSSSSPAEPFGSVVDAGADKWFLDALNGSAPAIPPHLERGRSEASSVVSEVPDYLFGLDTNSSASSPTTRSKPDPFSDDGPADPLHPHLRHHDHGLGLPNYAAVNPLWRPEPVPLYCVPAPVHGRSLPIQPVSMPVQYVPSLGGQLPVEFAPPVRGLLPGPFYMAGPPGAGVDRYEAPAAGGVIVGPGFVPVYPPAPPGGVSMGAGHAGESPGIAGGDLRRASQ